MTYTLFMLRNESSAALNVLYCHGGCTVETKRTGERFGQEVAMRNLAALS